MTMKEETRIISSLPVRGKFKCRKCNILHTPICPKCKEEENCFLILNEIDGYFLMLGILLEDVLKNNKMILQAHGHNIKKMDNMIATFSKLGMEIKRSKEAALNKRTGANITVEKVVINYNGSR